MGKVKLFSEVKESESVRRRVVKCNWLVILCESETVRCSQGCLYSIKDKESMYRKHSFHIFRCNSGSQPESMSLLRSIKDFVIRIVCNNLLIVLQWPK